VDGVHAQEVVSAALVLLATAVAGWVVARIFRTYEARSERALSASPAAHTRWVFLRRVCVAAIVAVGVSVALLKLPVTHSVAQTTLASSAVLAVIAGFAAQSTLSNVVAGAMLAINQPIRIGDRVRIEGLSGLVEEVGWSYTYVRGDDGRQLIYPNSLLAQRMVENSTIRGGEGRILVRAPVRISDVDRVRREMRVLGENAGLHEVEVVVSDLQLDAAVLELRGWAGTWQRARAIEEEMRWSTARALVAEGS